MTAARRLAAVVRGMPGDPWDDEATAHRAAAGLGAVMGCGSLLLAALTQLATGAQRRPDWGWYALLVATAETAFVLAATRRKRTCPSRRAVAAVISAAAVVVLACQLHSLPPDALSSSEAWSQQYAVVSCVIVGLLAPVGDTVGCAAVVSAAYMALTLAARTPHEPSALAVTIDNGISFPLFAGLAVFAGTLYRSGAALAGRLRAEASASRAEQARLAVTARAHRVAHDIGKAFLRELLSEQLSPEQLARWAAASRSELTRALGGPAGEQLDARIGIAALCARAAESVVLTADLSGLGSTTEPAPVVLLDAVREALTNARFHAVGAPVRVVAGRTPRGMIVEVSDAGPGFDLAAVQALWRTKPTPFGRLRQAGGSYHVTCSATGTTVRLVHPL